MVFLDVQPFSSFATSNKEVTLPDDDNESTQSMDGSAAAGDENGSEFNLNNKM